MYTQCARNLDSILLYFFLHTYIMAASVVYDAFLSMECLRGVVERNLTEVWHRIFL